MKKINIEKFIKAENLEAFYIKEKIKERKTFLYNYGMRFGIGALIISAILFIYFLIVKLSIFSNLWFIPELITVSGICSIIGAKRAKKENELYQSDNFLIRKGKIVDVRRKNCYCTYVDIIFDDEQITLSNIGNQYRKNDGVFITIADKEQAKWVLPRIILIEKWL